MTMWNNVILCLGSNTDCEANLKSAASLLRAYFGSIRFSEAIYTEPIGLPDSGLFLNQVAVAGTNASLEEVRRAVKAMEKRLGRMPDSKQKGKIPIDIDLLLWNGTILKPADWEKEYVQLLFRSVPSFSVNFRSFLDFGTASQASILTTLKSDLLNVSKSTSSANNGSIFTLERSICTLGADTVASSAEPFTAAFSALFSARFGSRVFIVGIFVTSLR